MSAQSIIVIGLVANMIGVALAFFFGYPQPSHEEGVALVVTPATPMPDGRTAGEVDAETRRQKSLYKVWSRVGLGFMFLGFLLQGYGTLRS